MKYIIAGIIALQISFCCDAQNTTADTTEQSINDSIVISEKNNLPADTNIVPSKWVAPWFVERFRIAAGFFVPVSNTNIKVGTNDGSIGTDIDFENDLGVDRTVGSFLANLQWRTTRRSRIDLSAYRVNRHSTYTLKKDINFADDTFHIGASAKSFFNTAIYRVSYGFAILAKPKFEVGVLIGAHIVGANVGISTDNDSAGIDLSDDFGFTAPLPDFGLWGGYAFSDRFAVNGEIDYLGLTIGDISGRILGYNFLVTYKVIKNLDIAVGYTGLGFRVDAVKTHLNGHLKWSYNGPNLTAVFSFGNKYWTH